VTSSSESRRDQQQRVDLDVPEAVGDQGGFDGVAEIEVGIGDFHPRNDVVELPLHADVAADGPAAHAVVDEIVAREELERVVDIGPGVAAMDAGVDPRPDRRGIGSRAACGLHGHQQAGCSDAEVTNNRTQNHVPSRRTGGHSTGLD
jgi:hypothetical protein